MHPSTGLVETLEIFGFVVYITLRISMYSSVRNNIFNRNVSFAMFLVEICSEIEINLTVK